MKYFLAAVAIAIFIALMIASIRKQKEAERKEKEYEERMLRHYRNKPRQSVRLELNIDTTKMNKQIEELRERIVREIIDYGMNTALSYRISNGLQVWLNI